MQTTMPAQYSIAQTTGKLFLSVPSGSSALTSSKDPQQDSAENHNELAQVDAPKPTSSDSVRKVIWLSEHVQNVRRELRFRVDGNSGIVVINVIDARSLEVIRQAIW